MTRQTLQKGILPLAFLAVACCGCSSVSITQPLSERSTVDQQKFAGTWVFDDQTIQVTFSDDGVGHLAGLQWDSGDYRITRAEIIVTQGKDCNYLSICSKDNGKKGDGYSFAQYTFTEPGDLVLWAPNVSAFAEAVDAGKLEGSVKREEYTVNVKITSPPTKVLAFLDDPANTWLFEYKRPLVLRKLDKSDDDDEDDDDA